ncbi:MAG: serine/threonine protein kinase [Pirellulaceae bacterium]
MTGSRNYLGSYRLIKLIRGGQACNVWEAVRDGQSERVAIKVLLERHAGKKEEIEQLRNEGRVGAELNHENVIRIFEYVDRYDLPFLVMQLFNARNLKQMIREDYKTLAVSIPEVIEQAALGLDYLHDEGWVHCDIKPDNYLVDQQGHVKLIDFSIAQPLKKQKRGGLFGKKTVQGTRSYMAPEQIRGKPMDRRTDVYGFGCVLHEMLAGKPPFSAGSPDELLQKHLRASPPGLLAFNKSVSEEFAQLVSRTLAKDPAKRPQSLSEFLQDYRKIRVYKPGKRPTLAD